LRLLLDRRFAGTRTLIATILIAIVGAVVLAHAPVGARGGTYS
jgi:hypothetical protein